jgi:hypothetical protein
MPTPTYAASSPEARAAVDVHIRKLVPEFIEYTFTKSAPYRNHWVGGGRVGNYGADYRLRTVANYAGIWANTSDEVIYFVATRDADERTFERLEQLCDSFFGGQAAGVGYRRVLVSHSRRRTGLPRRAQPAEQVQHQQFLAASKGDRRFAETSDRAEAHPGRCPIQLAAVA